MSNVEVVLCSPVRTAIGTYGGTLKDVAAPTLGAAVIRESLRRAGLAADKVHSLVMGNVIQAGVKMNPGRQAGIAGGLPVGVPALTVNRVCGSGAQAIASAATEIWAGMIECALAGGMENMDRSPYLLPQGRWGARMGDVTLFDSMLLDGLNDAFSGQHSGWHTEDLVAKCGISREDQDRWALRSQQRFAQAQAAGLFDAEIVPLEVPGRKGPTVFVRDEHNRPDTSAESLARLKPAFRKDGTITAGNAPGLNSGAAAMVVADRGLAETQWPRRPWPGWSVMAWQPWSPVSSAWARFPRCDRQLHAPGGLYRTWIAWKSTRRLRQSRWRVCASSALRKTL
jgi:acetyl-CoA C-acetyltransferase